MANANPVLYREYMKHYMRSRYLKLKHDAVKYKGGKCMECGYDKCYGAMVFHHRDPESKEFDWRDMRKLAWSRITTELDKCDLLCSRCHAEEHYDPSLLEAALVWLAAHARPTRSRKVRLCARCQKEFSNRNQRFCSPKCSNQSQTRGAYPSDPEFLQQVDALGRVKTGKIYGVSSRMVAKRYNRIKAPL